MKIDADTGIVYGARQLASPNCDQRPVGASISLLVIHNISLPPACFGGPHVDELFTNCLDPAADPFFAQICDLRVSAHLFIDRRGRMTQYVPLTHRAWHAGVSVFEGRERCNDFSIGIELEGTDERPYTQKQYQRLIAMTRRIRRAWPAITTNRIVGHCDIAPGRKTDPGPAFDWQYFRRTLSTSSAAP